MFRLLLFLSVCLSSLFSQLSFFFSGIFMSKVFLVQLRYCFTFSFTHFLLSTSLLSQNLGDHLCPSALLLLCFSLVITLFCTLSLFFLFPYRIKITLTEKLTADNFLVYTICFFLWLHLVPMHSNLVLTTVCQFLVILCTASCTVSARIPHMLCLIIHS